MAAVGTLESASCRSHRLWWIALAFVLLVAGCGQLVASAGSESGSTVFDETPTTAECETETGATCLDANQIRDRYGLDRLAAKGLTGKGVTIAVLDISGAPSHAEDLEEYSSRMGLPPPDLRSRDVELGYEPFVDYDPSDPRVVEAAMHTSRQLQLIHAIAPRATILLERLRFPTDEDLSRPVDELLAIRLRALVNEQQADVVLLGHGVPERTVSERTAQASDILRNRRPLFDDAARNGVTVVASGGARPSWPAVDPGVLTVGGRPGRSLTFELPDYQVNQSSLNEHDDERRVIPDLSFPAGESEHFLIYQTVSGRGGWAPVRVNQAERLVGLLALAAQGAGGALGHINDDVYYLASQTAGPERSGLRASKPKPGRPGSRVVTDTELFVGALADSARRPERSVPDERPKPAKRCQQNRPIDLEIQDHENVRLTSRLCVLHDPAKKELTGRITVEWRPLKGAEDSPGTVDGRFEDFEVRTVVERAGQGHRDRTCAIEDDLNGSDRGAASCELTISEPAPDSWSTGGRLAWKRAEFPGGAEPKEKLRSSPPLDVEQE